MRKQTKIVAVASAAALLAIGASMTSFAATGWVEEDGQWYFYDKDGNKVEDDWKKSGDNWYWLDSEEGGAMATDKLIEDDDDTYYVDGNGVMVKNTWVKVVNEDQDDDSDPAEYRYYYMQNSGKAYKAGNNDNTKFRTIDGKRYAFDADGKMLYGWVGTDAELAAEDDGWKDATYYLGSWEDGALKTGWQRVTVYDDEDGKDDDYEYWFNFKSNGEKRANKDGWKSNNKYYSFDSRGVMIYQWAVASGGDTSSVSDWRYYSSPEDGARQTKGWFKVVAPGADNDNTFLENLADSDTFATSHSNDESEKWYYAQDKGVLTEGIIKNIKGKYYGFYPEENTAKAGAMLNGLCILKMESATSDEIAWVIEEDIDSDTLDDILSGDYIDDDGNYPQTGWDSTVRLYYFGDDEDSDGAMKTGSVNISLDGSTYSFYFKKNGNAKSGRGKGVTGLDDNKYIYKNGCRIKADSDDKYQLVDVYSTTGGSLSINADDVEVDKIDVPAFSGNYENKDEEQVNYAVLKNLDYRLVNTSGAIQKSKSGVKDGNDCYFYVNKNYIVELYTDNKTVKTESNASTVITGWEDVVTKTP